VLQNVGGKVEQQMVYVSFRCAELENLMLYYIVTYQSTSGKLFAFYLSFAGAPVISHLVNWALASAQCRPLAGLVLDPCGVDYISQVHSTKWISQCTSLSSEKSVCRRDARAKVVL
jgi:hypothetical protein